MSSSGAALDDDRWLRAGGRQLNVVGIDVRQAALKNELGFRVLAAESIDPVQDVMAAIGPAPQPAFYPSFETAIGVIEPDGIDQTHTLVECAQQQLAIILTTSKPDKKSERVVEIRRKPQLSAPQAELPAKRLLRPQAMPLSLGSDTIWRRTFLPVPSSKDACC